MIKSKNEIPGIIFCLIISIFSSYLGKIFPLIGGPVFAIFTGIFLISFFPNLKNYFSCNLDLGINFTSKKILRYSIILLGFEMNLFNVVKVGKQSLSVIFFTISASFITAFIIGKFLNIKKNTTILIGVGTCICGGSAIAATAPVINANDEEIAHSISTIFLFNIIAVFIFPLLGHLLNMTDMGFGMWAGTAINDTSSVVAAASSWSLVSQNNIALNFATIVKLTRTIMIIPVTLFLAFYTTNKNKFNIIKIFPWFVIGFLLASIINTIEVLPIEFSSYLGKLGKFMIVMAMSAIGLNTNVKKLISNGIKPIILGLSCWFSVAIVSLFVQNFIKLW